MELSQKPVWRKGMAQTPGGNQWGRKEISRYIHKTAETLRTPSVQAFFWSLPFHVSVHVWNH